MGGMTLLFISCRDERSSHLSADRIYRLLNPVLICLSWIGHSLPRKLFQVPHSIVIIQPNFLLEERIESDVLRILMFLPRVQMLHVSREVFALGIGVCRKVHDL